MSKTIALLSAVAFSTLALTATIVAPARAEEKTVMVGGAAMFPSKNIIQNAVNSKDHTTLVAAVVLMQYGSGPVRGFAVTLTIGLLASMFTSIVVTRAIMDYLTRNESARLSV